MDCRYKSGLMLIGVVVFIWVSSAEVTQRIFRVYEQPFAVTYLGASLMVIYLPISFVKEWMCNCLKRRSPESPLGYIGGPGFFEMESQEPFSRKGSDLDLSQYEEGIALVGEHGDGGRVMRYKYDQIAKYGFYIAPLWFITEYLSNAALLRTSVASSTVLSSTSGLFTLLIGALLGEDSINVAKAVSVVVSILGVVLTTLGGTWASDDDLHQDSRRTFVGDVLGLLSAVSYGLFTVLLNKFCGHEERRVQKLFGYIGLSTIVSLWWLIWPLKAMGIEAESTLPSSGKVAELVVANGLIGSVLSDYCWALSVVWTTPLVATLGMSLTIPVAMVSDMIIHGRQYSLIYVIGSIQVFAGFIIANLSDWLSAL
ncbi:uncharacterized vacuolar membrane protein YML018C-like isoform X1 [Salvia hispanica]|uniref:uncharacterized vacuolar membrane protein YML018C-like isoform X1 n=2 Tax=Salvia hispanica TaxID=49212 RepID=UPI00200940A2|nr:uncharacterized vacuolar membrane protein YML018C-like isoform X1 [Salvia hispanica]